MRIAAVVPIDPTLRGNGLAHRARFWCTALSEGHDLTTIVVPVSGPTPTAADSTTLVLPPEQLDHPWLPGLAQQAPEYLGARWSTEIEPFDVIVGHRLYLAPFCIGLRGASDAKLVIDLDDDDASYFRQIGDHVEAEKYTELAKWTAQSADLVISATATAGALVLPNSVAVPSLSEPVAPRPGRPPSIALVGNLNYSPNAEGAAWFEERVLPAIRAEHPDAVFTLAGPGSGEASSNGVGFVDDLAALYARTDVVVVPLMHGSGSRIKALEAWAHGVPVVGTTVGLEGLDADRSHAAVIADAPGSFARAVSRLLANPLEASAMGVAGRDHVSHHFEEDIIMQQARSVVNRVQRGDFEPHFGPAADLGINEVRDGLAIYEPSLDTAHHLNATASIIFMLIDRPLTLDQVAAELALAVPETELSTPMISSIVDELVSKRLLQRSAASPG